MNAAPWIIPGLAGEDRCKLGVKTKRERKRTCNPRESEKGTLAEPGREECRERRTRRMLINRSAPHPLSRKTPRGGRIMAKLGKDEDQRATPLGSRLETGLT